MRQSNVIFIVGTWPSFMHTSKSVMINAIQKSRSLTFTNSVWITKIVKNNNKIKVVVPQVSFGLQRLLGITTK